MELQYEQEKRMMFEKTLSSFYENMSTDIKEFIETSSKIYILILEQMKDNKHNKEILNQEDDVDTLSILIASYFYQTEVSKYYEEYDISLEKILKYLNIKISKEEIENVELNPQILVKRFNRFVREGVNSNKRIETITINDISDNLCNREFNKSMIMENLFYKLSNGKTIESDFLKKLKTQLKQKENMRKKQLSESFFQDLSVDIISYLEIVSMIYQHLIKQEELDYSKEDRITLSLLLGFYKEESEVKEFLEYLGINIEELEKYLNISLHYMNEEKNIDILVNEFSPYIFEGINKEKSRREISLFSILENIMNQEFNNSVEISKLLDHFDLSYEDFKDFEQEKEEFRKHKEKMKRKEQGKSKMNQYNYGTQYNLEYMLRVYAYIKDHKENLLDEEKKELSLIITSFQSDTIKAFYEKHGITLDLLLKKYHLEELKNEKISIVSFTDEINYFLIDHFSKYLEGISDINKENQDITDIVKVLFDESISNNDILRSLLSEEEYNKLKKEIMTGKDYEASLSIQEKMELLRETKMDSIDRENMESVLQFGSELIPHAKYIYEELPRLVEEDKEESSLETIQEMMSRIYQKEEPKKSRNIFMRIFSTGEDEKELKINQKVMEELRNSMEENIKVLSKELLGYDAIRKYMEIYRKKNLDYLECVNQEIQYLEDNLHLLNPENENEYIPFLHFSSLVQIMKDKRNRFQTTNHVTNQELIRINQAIVNHFITINALEMAKNDLFPLIASELSITRGRRTEKEALELSHGVMNLFQALLSRNVEEATSHLELLKRSNLPTEILDSLNNDMVSLITNINTSKRLEEKSSKFSMEELKPQDEKSLRKKKEF